MSARLEARGGGVGLGLRRLRRVLGLGVAAAGVLVFLTLTVGPRVTPFRYLVVETGSMEPALPTGSLIVVERVAASELRVGDVITVVRDDGARVTHRIVDTAETDDGRPAFRTKGDANPATDSWVVPAEGRGYVHVATVGDVRFLQHRFQGRLWRTLLISVPAVLLGALFLRDIWQPRPRPVRT